MVGARPHPAVPAASGTTPAATGGELAPVEAEFDDKQGSERERDEAEGGEGVALGPVAGPEIEHAAGDEGKRDCKSLAPYRDCLGSKCPGATICRARGSFDRGDLKEAAGGAVRAMEPQS
jgi:hypothetical protein